ncbi:hypothetical protein [Halolamina rubra]|uniref:hypothetical protein n=1 Tax=Halolamina rubra TaxID=1380430 RepID=UPI001929863F|nr:hypothetical protein [Halolamina rubra]
MLTYPMEIGRNIDEILRSLRALQRSDEEDGVAVPADWPENEVFGDRVLLSPPGTVDEAESRTAEAEAAGEMEAYDWWFVTRSE